MSLPTLDGPEVRWMGWSSPLLQPTSVCFIVFW